MNSLGKKKLQTLMQACFNETRIKA